MTLLLPTPHAHIPPPAAPRDQAVDELRPTFGLAELERWSAAHARLWLAAGGSPDARDEHGFPLTIAALNSLDPIGVLRELHAAGADLDSTEPDFEWTALHFAIANHAAPGVLHFLLERGCSLERSAALAWNPLLIAAAGGTAEAVGLLLKAGADPNVCDAQGATPLAVAVQRADALPVVELLLAYGACPRRSNRWGETALMMAAMTQLGGGVVRALLEAGADPHAQTQEGATALLLAACSSADAANIEALLEFGADPLVRSRNGSAVLESVVMMADDPRSVNLLLRAGCDPRSRGCGGESLLGLARTNPAFDRNPAFRQYCEQHLDA